MAPKAKPAATKFDAAVAKAKSKSASSKAGYPSASTTAKAAAPAAPLKPLTLEDSRKLVEKTDFKIEDIECEIANENDTKAKKALQAKIKKLQDDPRYEEAKKKIEEAAEEKRRQKLLTNTALSTANVVKADAKEADAKEEEVEIEEDVSVGAAHGHFTSISKAKTDDDKLKAGKKFGAQIRGLGMNTLHQESFAERIEKMLKGKDKEEKAWAWAAVAGVGWATPYVEHLFKQGIDGVDTLSLAAVKSMMENASPNGIGRSLVPQLIEAITDKKWKTQMRAIQVTPAAWSKLSKSSTVSKHAPQLLPVLNASMQAIRADVKDAGKVAVNEIFKKLYNPEIRSLSGLILPAMEDPSKQDLTWKALGQISNTTFMNYIDAGSLAFLVPILTRAMRERNAESKMKASRILGSLIILVFNRATLTPYLPACLPLLRECIVDTSAEVQTEAANTVGNLARYLTDIYDEQVEPWLFETLRSKELNERQGCAKALAQAMLALGEPRLGEVIDRATATAADRSIQPTTRSGALELLEACSDVLKDDFSKHVPNVMKAILPRTSEQDEIISGPAYRAAKSLVDWFSDSKPKVLFYGLETGLVDPDEMCRVNTVTLAKRVVEKVLGRKKDFLKVESSVSVEQRSNFVAAMYINRYDQSNEVRRNVSKFLQESVVSLPETFRAIKTKLIEKLNDYAAGTETQRMLAEKSCAELSSAEDWDPEAVKISEANADTNGDAEPSKTPQSETLEGYETAVKGDIDMEKLSESDQLLFDKATQAVKSSLGVSPEVLGVSQEVLDFAGSVAVDVAMSCGIAAEKYEAALQNALVGFLDRAERDKLVEGLCKAMGAKRERLGTDQGETTLCCVDNLFLCYGGGKLLLRDTTLELIKDHRYGVVGRNGCGKTTLMNQMSAGGLAGMPPELKCVHVKHEVLPTIQELTPVEFCRRECPKIDNAGIDHWLNDVGFPMKEKNTKVAELSGGFCMRLILACGLMQDPDVLLLDEPTNHLDEESMNWLADYLNSMTRSSLMVVSHEPAFLDKICTDIIQYREMKMCYYKGNFTSFREQAGISDADCADILDGGPAAEKTGTAGGGDDSDDEVLVGYGTGARSKISFPIPMKLTGVSASKPILETKNLAFGYIESEPPIFHEVNLKVTQTSRIALTGRNGSGKSTLLALVAGELNARVGDVLRHRNLRIAYIPQNQLFYLSDFNELTPQAYIQARYKSGYDELVQTRLLQFKDEEDRQKRIELAKKYGKQGAMVRTIVGRTVKGKDILYEVAWEGLPDEKQNTQEPFSKLKQMGAEGEARAFDERNSVLSNSQDIRPVTRREIIKHFELFGLDEDMICNRQIGGFSAGQKSKLMLASSMWTRPQAILLDEPTNYVDVETLDAIARALRTFRGGLIISSRDQSFLDKVCTETWLVDGGCVTSSKRETYNAGD